LLPGLQKFSHYQAKKRKHPAVVFDVPEKLYVSQKRKHHWGTRRPNIDEGSVLYTMHSNQLYDHSSIKKDLYTVWLSRICTELAEGLPTGFKLELSKNGKLLFINPRWQKMIFSFKCKTNSWKPE
jgi:hypothetical protein